GKIDHKYHDGSEVMSDLYPENRRLDPDYAERILDMMDVKANKKFLQAKIKSDTEKTVFIKDLHNLSKKRKKVTQENCLTMAADYLKDKGATVHILKKNLEFMGLSFYTPDMIKAMAAYPEIIFMDG
ncbi:GSCOCG00010701001-RA-CDS, partial [Cotesia congregata]